MALCKVLLASWIQSMELMLTSHTSPPSYLALRTSEVLLDKEELTAYCQEAYGLQETIRSTNQTDQTFPTSPLSRDIWDF